MYDYVFVIPGNPVPKGRPRFGRGRTYTPKKTLQAEKDIRENIRRQIGVNFVSIDSPIYLDIVFVINRPKYMYAKKYSDGRIPHTKKPDLDNLVKTVCDALDGYFFVNDSRISKLSTTKVYAEKNEPSKTIIRVMYDKKNTP